VEQARLAHVRAADERDARHPEVRDVRGRHRAADVTTAPDLHAARTAGPSGSTPALRFLTLQWVTGPPGAGSSVEPGSGSSFTLSWPAPARSSAIASTSSMFSTSLN